VGIGVEDRKTNAWTGGSTVHGKGEEGLETVERGRQGGERNEIGEGQKEDGRKGGIRVKRAQREKESDTGNKGNQGLDQRVEYPRGGGVG